MNKKLTYKKKSTLLFIEYFTFSLFFQITLKILRFVTQLDYFNDFFVVIFLCFLIYYTICEFIFKRTLVMHFYRIKLDCASKSNFQYIMYSTVSIADRTIFAPFHLLLAFMNYENLLLCEKLSGIRWKLNDH